MEIIGVLRVDRQVATYASYRSGLLETLDTGLIHRCRRLAHRTIWLTRQL